MRHEGFQEPVLLQCCRAVCVDKILFLPLSNLEPSGPKNTTVGWVITSLPLRKKMSHAVIPDMNSAKQEIPRLNHGDILESPRRRTANALHHRAANGAGGTVRGFASRSTSHTIVSRSLSWSPSRSW